MCVCARVCMCVCVCVCVLTFHCAHSEQRDEVGVWSEAGQLVHLIKQKLHLLICSIFCRNIHAVIAYQLRGMYAHVIIHFNTDV